MKNVFIVFLTSFVLGALCSWSVFSNENMQLWKTQEYQADSPLNMTEFWDVYNLIGDEYFREGGIEKQDLEYGAIKWMVEALWDKNSEFMTPEVYKRFDEVLNGKFEGIGAVVEKVPLWVMIERIIKWSPAKKFGVRSWDIVTQANGEDLVNLDLYDAVEQIKGPAWSTVVLTILRAWESGTIDIAVERAEIDIPSVEEEYFEDSEIAYIALNQYWDTTASEFRQALENVKESQARGLIIDVRDNGGWYLGSAVEILSEFIPGWELLVQTRYQDSAFNQNYLSVNTWEIYDKKIIVLMNGNSASASEITAGALREYDKAILVWEQTFGKWSVQQPFEMQGGSLLKLTVAKWFTPKNRNIEEEGIEPDIEIFFQEEDYENEYDRQLEEAKKILDLYIENKTIGLTVEAYDTANPIEETVVENVGTELEQE